MFLQGVQDVQWYLTGCTDSFLPCGFSLSASIVITMYNIMLRLFPAADPGSPRTVLQSKGVENEGNWAGALASKILMCRSATEFIRWVDILTQARNTFQHGITRSYPCGFFDKPHGTLCMNINVF